jgi:signal transduction histidine kinase
MRRLEETGQVARSSLDQARRVIWALRPEALEHGSLGRALGQLAAEFGSRTGIDTHSTVTGAEAGLDPSAQEALLRIAQEALANVRKHARAHRVRLTLSYLDDATLLDVRDDGTGFDPAVPAGNGSGGGFGLAGMRERLAAHGGTLTIETAPGQGTTVAAALPRGPANAGRDR